MAGDVPVQAFFRNAACPAGYFDEDQVACFDQSVNGSTGNAQFPGSGVDSVQDGKIVHVLPSFSRLQLSGLPGVRSAGPGGGSGRAARGRSTGGRCFFAGRGARRDAGGRSGAYGGREWRQK